MPKATRNVALVNKPDTNKYTIIIPAAGKGSRMTTYGPKSLLSIGKKCLIDKQLEIIQQSFNVCEIVLVTGFHADKVMNHTPNTIIKIENELYEQTNVARSIGLGLRAATTNRVVVIYGDLAFNKDALSAPFDKESLLIIDNGKGMKDEEVGCVIDKHRVEQMFFDLPNKWAQIAFFTGKELEMLKEITWNKANNMLFGFEVINQIIDNGGNFKAYTPKNIKVTDIDMSKDIDKARKILV